MNPGGGGCDELRLCHCTPAWATRAKLWLKNKSKNTPHIYYLFLCIISPVTVSVSRLPSRYWPGLQSYQKLSWDKIHFHVASGYWQNSSACSYRQVTIFLLTVSNGLLSPSKGHPQFFALRILGCFKFFFIINSVIVNVLMHIPL